MKIWISNSSNQIVTCLSLEPKDAGDVEILCLEGELPAGLTVHDLAHLGIVLYEPGTRGRPIPRVCPIEPSENLDYLRAMVEAMPPGYFVSKVESEKIDQLQREKEEKFHRELEKFDTEDGDF